MTKILVVPRILEDPLSSILNYIKVYLRHYLHMNPKELLLTMRNIWPLLPMKWFIYVYICRITAPVDIHVNLPANKAEHVRHRARNKNGCSRVPWNEEWWVLWARTGVWAVNFEKKMNVIQTAMGLRIATSELIYAHQYALTCQAAIKQHFQGRVGNEEGNF